MTYLLQICPFSERTIFYPHVTKPILFLNLTTKVWIVFQSDVSHEEVFGMSAAGTNGGTFFELQKGGTRPHVGSRVLELVLWNRAELHSHLQWPR